ncbi:uncharacterized protein YecE (DUF72 family) [Microbacteriaceae bacterium SG_E_30_P1]|uniref:Uncharacterized protein YecE (DUF72 family) n=1 Tax=Antiquaquibacter oligotrophicus TaxID=2880260 RepID=A0ABT6KM24_9MICO|nr:DUF72 domain-containing protein [Antiquaquibacter oligotrophicus]MDH6181063.1 uncharacterized protein YecE (DUF72 family) [Antiquaquibacter oligotrophicus]UDF13239.1 DUF72 domain-containing protein [Antiquaquibacter oligotrophicus]
MAGQIRVGMAGWVYPDWRGTFYPAGLTQKRELEYASRHVTSIELNGSFYSLQKPTSWLSWRDATPDDFVFAVKAPRFITHIRRLDDVAEPLSNFFASGILALGAKLGPILWQLPPSQEFEPFLLERFFSLLPHDTTAAAALAAKRSDRMHGSEYLLTDAHRTVRHAIEVRHHSFASPEFTELARGHGIAIVYGDSDSRWPVIDERTADFRYARLHAHTSLHPHGSYDGDGIAEWAERTVTWSRSGDDVFVYFDDDSKVRAPHDAQSLLAALQPDVSNVLHHRDDDIS